MMEITVYDEEFEELEAENAKLRDQEAAWTKALTSIRQLAYDRWQETKRLREQRDEAVKLLREYGRHHPSCRCRALMLESSLSTAECDCGLAAAIARVEGEQK